MKNFKIPKLKTKIYLRMHIVFILYNNNADEYWQKFLIPFFESNSIGSEKCAEKYVDSFVKI